MSFADRLAVVALLGSLACAGQPEAAPEEQEADLRQNVQFGDPLPGLSAADKTRFLTGQEAFTEVEGMADGLGPVFNEASCAACHSVLVTTAYSGKWCSWPFLSVPQ